MPQFVSSGYPAVSGKHEMESFQNEATNICSSAAPSGGNKMP